MTFAPPNPDAAGRRGPLLGAALLLASLPALVFPGDAAFINDEPQLILNAIRANAGHGLAAIGLVGTKGVPYGPLPTWIYQGLLLVTHEPIAIVFLHAALLAAALVLALWWLSRSLDVWPWLAPAVLLSPYLWLYERFLWDNTFNLALSAVLVAAYADFLSRRRPASLALALACAVGALLVHLMALALVIPVLAHVAVFERRAVRRHPWTVVPALALAAAATPYWRALLAARSGPAASLGVSHDGLVFPLFGARLLTATGVDYFGFGGLATAAARAAAAVSAGWFVLSWAGMLVAAAAVVRAVRSRAATPRDHVAGLALAVVAAQCALDGLSHSSRHPHYYNATWIAFALLAWLAIDALARARRPVLRALRWSVLPVGAAAGAVTLALLVDLHATRGTRGGYGPTIATQVDVVRTLAQYDPAAPVEISVPNFVAYPYELEAIRALLGAPSGAALPASRVVVRPASEDPRDGRIEVAAF